MAFGTGFWNKYPGTDLHEIDLQYVLMQLLQMRKDMQEVVDSQAITFADPINWDITSQYPANQVVLDSNGDGFISRQPVPVGIPLGNSNYWTQIFSFNDIADRIRASIALNAGTSATTPRALDENDLVWWQGDIYRAMVNMPAGTAFIEGTNVERFTVDDKIDMIAATINQFVTELQNLIDRVDGLDGALTDEVQDREDADTALQTAIDDEIRDRIAADDALDDRIDYVNSRIQQYFGNRGNWFYVDGSNGSDDNDGSQDHPYKTIEKALLEANNGYANLSIGILSAGTYTVDDYNNLTYLSLHIYSYVPNVIIDFAPADFTTYGLHLSLRGDNGPLTIRGGEGGFHFESGQLYAQNVYFNFECRIIGTNCHFIDCQFDNIHATESNIVFNGTLAFHNAQHVAVVVRLVGGVCSFYQNSISLDEAPDEGTTFILVQAGVVAGFPSADSMFSQDLTHKYQYGLRSYNSVIAVYAPRVYQLHHIADTPFTRTAGTITAPCSMFYDAVDITGYTSSSNAYGIGGVGYINIYNTSEQSGAIYVQGNQGGTISIGGAPGRYSLYVAEGMKAYVTGTCSFARYVRAELSE